jgi:pyrroline-5-carboxylate reductase
MKNIGIIGFGNLGRSLTSLLIKNNLRPSLRVSSRNMERTRSFVYQQQDNINNSDILFLTVKPNNVKEVCDDINKYSNNTRKTIVSAAAAVPIKKINDWTYRKHQVIRCMPNLPISIGDGSIVWHDPNNDNEIKKVIEESTKGPNSIWVKDEKLVDVATVISGCTPAYVGKLFESYVDSAVKQGFTEEESRFLLRGVFSGTSKFLEYQTGHEIMDSVASKGGVTEKGLKILDERGFCDMIDEIVTKSLDRINDIKKQK